jgi:hypothetical protein
MIFSAVACTWVTGMAIMVVPGLVATVVVSIMVKCLK